jgi:hypothetical protein
MLLAASVTDTLQVNLMKGVPSSDIPAASGTLGVAVAKDWCSWLAWHSQPGIIRLAMPRRGTNSSRMLHVWQGPVLMQVNFG